MAQIGLYSPDISRRAVVYQIVNSTWWRIRVERYPETSGWFGGRVLWGHDKPTKAEAMAVGEAWTERGELPEGVLLKK